jgi:hypothetical protein
MNKPVDAEGGPVTRPRYCLVDLVADLDHDALCEAFDWGTDQGREVMD